MNEEAGSQETDRLTEEAFNRREKLWQSVGEIEPRVFAPIINPALTGGPEWPNMSQGFRLIKLQNGNTVLATEGLSNPFRPGHPLSADGSGFGLEFYVETDEDLGGSIHSWQFDILNQVAQNAAYHGDFREILDDIKYVSMELNGVRVPVGYRYPREGQGGVLLGLPSKTIPASVQLPKGDALLVSVTMLHPQELEIAAQGEDARNKLAEQFTQKYDEPLSSVIREPLA